MLKVTRTEHGWPAHFVQADRCLFRRNTLLQLNEFNIIVSTVGNMRDEKGVIIPIGSDRFYETMAFVAHYADGYWSTAGDPVPIPLTCRIFVSRSDLYHLKGMADNFANDMHEDAVERISIQMVRQHELIHGTGEGKPMGITP